MYKVLYISTDGLIEEELNAWAESGWRLISVIPPVTAQGPAIFVLEKSNQRYQF